MSNYAGQVQAKPDAHGLDVIVEGLQQAHALVDQTFQHLEALNERLYAPKPQPIATSSAATPGAIENNLNALNSRLRQLEQLAQTVLHG